jgi:hypothetical protein
MNAGLVHWPRMPGLGSSWRRGRRRVRSIFVGGSVAVAVFTAAPAAFAQSTREATIEKEQAEKAQHLEPETSPKAERVLVRIMSSPLLAGTGGFYPWLGSVYNGTGLAGGLGYFHRGANRQRFEAMAALSINGSVATETKWHLPLIAQSKIRPKIEARWARFEHVVYHGIGSGTTESDRSFFHYRPHGVDAGLVATPKKWFSLTASYGYTGLETEADQASAVQARPLPGIDQTIDYGVARAGALLDWRQSPGYSTSGGFIRGEWERYRANHSKPFDFDVTEVEAAHLIPLLREQYVLAFRALATTTSTTAGDEVPFILLPSIGGGDTVRGLANRRFSDRSRVVLTGEYRWRPSRFVDMAIFLDSGAVAPRLEDIDQDRFESAWGIGARFHGPAFSALRLELARGREGWRAIFAAAQPF